MRGGEEAGGRGEAGWVLVLGRVWKNGAERVMGVGSTPQGPTGDGVSHVGLCLCSSGA